MILELLRFPPGQSLDVDVWNINVLRIANALNHMQPGYFKRLDVGMFPGLIDSRDGELVGDITFGAMGNIDGLRPSEIEALFNKAKTHHVSPRFYDNTNYYSDNTININCDHVRDFLDEPVAIFDAPEGFTWSRCSWGLDIQPHIYGSYLFVDGGGMARTYPFRIWRTIYSSLFNFDPTALGWAATDFNRMFRFKHHIDEDENTLSLYLQFYCVSSNALAPPATNSLTFAGSGQYFRITTRCQAIFF